MTQGRPIMNIAQLASVCVASLLTTTLVGAPQQGQVQKGKVQTGQPLPGFPGPIRQTPWFSNPDVRSQLKISDEHFTRLNKAYADAWARYEQSVNELAATLTPEQRALRLQDLQQ